MSEAGTELNGQNLWKSHQDLIFVTLFQSKSVRKGLTLAPEEGLSGALEYI